MSWNYRVLKEPIDNINTFRIIEVHYDDSGKIEAWNDNTANILVWTSLDDLKGTVEYLSGAFQKPVLIKTNKGELIEE
ncbi:hypothetical protein [Ammoniphilus sp. 3BR4]|uniref:hypothetical protein n=1 Tax=Ammoniphilus sp. 3BR4 TaxID=3158265 RepID=UPI0034672055